MILRSLLVGMALIGLAGCSSAKAQARHDMEAYFSAVCEKEGFAKGSQENTGCVVAKVQQSTPAKGGGYMPIPPKTSMTCQQFGNMTRCY